MRSTATVATPTTDNAMRREHMNPEPTTYTPEQHAALPVCRRCGRRLIDGHAWSCPDLASARSAQEAVRVGLDLRILLGQIEPVETTT